MTDVAITGIDEKESYRRSGGFLETVFILTPVPSPEWCAAFDEKWDELEAFPKRHVRLEKGCAVLVCLEHELQGGPKEMLDDAIARTNASFRTT